LLQVNNLTVKFPSATSGRQLPAHLTAVRNVSFDIHQGEIFGLVGESGCGKTSLGRALIRLVKPSAGKVKYRGQTIGEMKKAELRQRQRKIQYLFQDPLSSLSPRRTVQQSLREPLDLYNIGDPTERPTLITQTLDSVGLQQKVSGQFPHELSGGQRQRVAFARALVAKPDLIIADEPMSSLDVSIQARIIKLIHHVRRETGVAFLLISHDLAVIQQLADRVAVMYLGKILEMADTNHLFRSPAHPYTRALFRAVPQIRNESVENTVPLYGEPPSSLTPPPGCVFHTRCSEAMDVCKKIEPPQTIVGDKQVVEKNHIVRCHLWSN
jgi:peptide/nickel transport system ATP-binding protein/oligopeptide transport system ATP-binding protein